MTAAGAPARPNRTPVYLAIVAGLVVAVAAGGLLFFNKDSNQPLASPPTVRAAAGLRVMPGGVLLPSVAATKQLAATAADGSAVSAALVWTSSKPDVVAVDGTGLLTARAFGSAQILAKAGDLESAPVLVTVVAPAAGTVLVDDSQVIGDPVETNPDAPVTADSTYDVVLRGVTVASGDLLLGTGEIPIGGRVVATTPSGDDTRVTLAPVSLPELLPDLEMDEVIDLSRAPIDIPSEVSTNYDISREGTTLRFTPKPAFDELVKAAAEAPEPVAGLLPAGPLANAGGALYGVAQGTYAVPPFGCEPEDEDEGPAIQPFKLTEAPSFEIDINPALDVLWTAAEKHVLLDAAPHVTVKVGLKSTVSFSTKWDCKLELGRVRIRAGWVALLITGLVPLGVGFEIGGEIQLAEFGITSTSEATSDLRFGIDCPPATSCSITGFAEEPQVETEVEVDVQELADFRVKPALELFGYMEFIIGNPFLVRLQVEAAEAKVGVKLESDWAPRLVQILDEDYASEYGLTAEVEAKAGPDLGSVAEKLGLDEILSVGIEESFEILGSPTGELSLDKDAYATGESGTATVSLEAEGLRIGPVYVIDRVLVVSYVNDQQAIIGTSDAADGQTEFHIAFEAAGPLSKDNLFAFVVPRIPGLDALALEIEQGAGAGRLLFLRQDVAQGYQLFSAAPDGSNERQIQLATGDGLLPQFITASPDGTRLAVATVGGVYIVNADGSGARKLTLASGRGATHAAWSPDGSLLIFASAIDRTGSAIWTSTPEGGSARELVSEPGKTLAMPTWSPDGTRFAYVRNATDQGIFEIWVANADGTNAHKVTNQSSGTGYDLYPQWSPDGSRILFLRLGAGGYQIWSMKPDGTDARALSSGPNDYHGFWSPDGTRIVFQRSTSAGYALVEMDADGSDQVQLPINGPVQFPSWVP